MSTLHPLTQTTLDIYNLLQIGCSIDINELEYLEAKRLIHFKHIVDEEEKKKLNKK